MKRIILSACLCFAILSSCERAIIFISREKPTIEMKENKGYVNGILGKTFYRKLLVFTKEHPNIKNLVLENIPGSVNDEWNVKSCSLIHHNGMNTELLPHSIIASGGVDLFISGNKRTIAKGAKIGVHSWSDGKKEGKDYPRDSDQHDVFIEMFDLIEMDTSFYWYTLIAAPANDIHWMSDEEIERYKLSKN